MIPLDFEIEANREEEPASTGGIRVSRTHLEIRFKALAYDPASRQCYQYTGTSNTLVAEAQIPPDRDLMGQACRELAKELGWTVTP